jgi:ubiquinone biosynthesis monooxygenase Coq7
MTKRPLSRKEKHRILRVDQAGEYGAKRIYAGQLAALKWRGSDAETLGKISHMAAQEDAHLQKFNTLVAKDQVRPTALQPVWHMAGFALGAVTALMGDKAAMACTAAVEEVIDEHYARQSEKLGHDMELKEIVDQFRAEENEHRETALANGAEEALGYPVLRKLIRAGSKTAIWLSERV